MFLSVLGAGLAGLTALHRGGIANAQQITDDTYFYGESPPVYPSPNITGAGSWAAAFAKAEALVSSLTLEEKINLTAGISSSNGCSGNIPAIPSVGFPGMCLSDAGNGLRSTDFVSSWPSGIHVGASFNKDLARLRASGMGNEYKIKGVNVLLGPVVGPVGRVVLSGRNWEGFSVDPYLSGSLVYETVSAIEAAGVITSTKHYIGNEQETNRNPTTDVASVSSNIDDQTMHELYLWPFQDAVKAGTGNIMCSYQRVNNSYGCANSYTLNGLLKTELGFQGWVVTDWNAQHAGVATALAGLDMAMPNDQGFWGANLTAAINNGSVPESRVSDMATRIIAAWYKAGQDEGFPTPGIGMPADLTAPHEIIDARDPSSKAVLFDGAVEGHVLVKNTNSALPLKSPRLLSVFGYSAKNPDSNNVGTAWSVGSTSTNLTALYAGFGGVDMSEYLTIAFNGTLYSGGGSGATSQSLAVSPFDAIVRKAYDDDTALFWDFTSDTPALNPASDACLVVVNSFATEGADRVTSHDDYTDGLIKHVASSCANTIVIFHNAGIRLVDQFIDHENVTALIFAHLPGQASGKALVSLLYGEENFSGKLPYTVAKNESDYAVLGADKPSGIYEHFPQSNFTEGVFIDYRQFDAQNIMPRYEFGFGLSYTTFSYANLTITKNASASFDTYPTGAISEGGQIDLWDILATVTADITNTGSVDGAEAAQLYLGIPDAPVRQLRGFEKPSINASTTATVSFDLTRRDLSVWDTTAQKWRLPGGDFTVYVGASSRNLPLEGTLTL